MQVAGLGMCLLLIDLIGRRRCLILFLCGTCLFLLPFFRPGGSLIAKQTRDSTGLKPAGMDPDPLDITMLFLTRMHTYGSFIVVFIYTPEVYPTRVRSYAFGAFNALCRLGGLVAPFIGVALVQNVCVHLLACNAVRCTSVNAFCAVPLTCCCVLAAAQCLLSPCNVHTI
jgi:MFS family permease